MSDPSAINLPVSQALTSDLLYGLKPSAPKSRSYRMNIAPLNKAVFSGNDSIVFEIPTGRANTYIDNTQTFLKFSVQCSSTAAASVGGSGIYLDNTAYSFFQRCDTYHSSNLLEQINEYGQIANMCIDTSLTKSDKEGLSALIGSNFTTTIITTAVSYAQFQGNTSIQAVGDRSGMSLASVATASGISTAIPYNFSLPFFNGVVGVNASKCIPLGLLNSPIRIEMTTSENDDAIYYGTAGAGARWQLVNVELVCTFIELNDDIPNDKSQPIYISSKSWRQASAYMPSATSGEFTTLLPFRFSSLCGLYAKFLNLSSAVQGANATAAYRKSSSINPNLSSYYFRVGNSGIIPNKPVYLINGSLVGTGSEGYAQLLASFHALSSSIGNTSISFPQYNVCATATQGWALASVPGAKTGAGTIDTHFNAFHIGQELETFSNRSDTILSGVSTLNTQTFFTGIINSGATAGGTNSYNYNAHFFANFDMILVIQDGIMSAKF
jgi:hypothetical protein